MSRKYCLLFISLFLFFKGFSQTDSFYNPKDDFSISAFPIAFFLPETGLAFGGLGQTIFNIGEEKSWRKSQVQLGIAYTLKKQLLIFAPYELYLNQNWKINGEVGYYRYFYNFYGIGINSSKDNLEFYDANYPRIISTVSYRFTDNFLAGISYRFDKFKIPKTDSLLTKLKPKGFNGGLLSTLGVELTYDSRNDIFYPSKGIFATLKIDNSSNFTFSNFDYWSVLLNASYYTQLADNHILALNFTTGSQIGNSPFYNYFYLSSGKNARGFDDRRFLDNNLNLFQAEYRFPIYKRLRGCAFTSLGTVSNTYSDLYSNPQKFSYGAGLRFQLNKKQLSHLRADVAHSYEGFQFYITIGEAF
ncbi:MAG: BamA/TamA family outer membrane protein [Flavobacteriales bacterium]